MTYISESNCSLLPSFGQTLKRKKDILDLDDRARFDTVLSSLCVE